MERKLSEKSEKELLFKKEWCMTIAHFVRPHFSHIPGVPSYEETIEKAFDIKFLRGMRMMYNDMNEMCEALPIDELRMLNDILRDKFGYDLNSVNKRLQKKAQTIIKRGKIRNDEEFYQMKPFIDYLLWTGDSKDEEDARELDRILCEYEQNSRPH